MRYAVASTLALVAAVSAAPQGVTSAISPQSSAPAGCKPSYDGKFQIQVVNATTSSKRSVQKRADLEITLQDGILKDSEGRTGYIAANRQFQFDGPPQTGAIYTAGWSVCANNSLAIGNDAVFYQCLSGNFYNLYDEAQAAQCSEVYIDVIGGSSSVAATQSADGQPAVTGQATQTSDGQIGVSSAASAGQASQISDGQIQAPSAAATASAAPVSQISDGQIQASTSAAAVSQISDGQVQASTAAAVTGAPVSQISDGQIQASTSAVSPVTQITDGQIQAPTGGAVAPKNGTSVTTGSPAQYTGAANKVATGAFGLVAVLGFVAAL